MIQESWEWIWVEKALFLDVSGKFWSHIKTVFWRTYLMWLLKSSFHFLGIWMYLYQQSCWLTLSILPKFLRKVVLWTHPLHCLVEVLVKSSIIIMTLILECFDMFLSSIDDLQALSWSNLMFCYALTELHVSSIYRILTGDMDGELPNIKKWIVFYPVYINSKKTIAEGRRLSISKACENPTCAEIGDCCSHLKLPFAIEVCRCKTFIKILCFCLCMLKFYIGS